MKVVLFFIFTNFYSFLFKHLFKYFYSISTSWYPSYTLVCHSLLGSSSVWHLLFGFVMLLAAETLLCSGHCLAVGALAPLYINIASSFITSRLAWVFMLCWVGWWMLWLYASGVLGLECKSLDFHSLLLNDVTFIFPFTIYCADRELSTLDVARADWLMAREQWPARRPASRILTHEKAWILRL